MVKTRENSWANHRQESALEVFLLGEIAAWCHDRCLDHLEIHKPC